MPSDLPVPLSCRCAILQVHSLEDGVFSISLCDMQHGLLYSFFLGQLLFFLLVFGFQSGIVGKKVKLLELPLGGGGRGFLDHMIGGDVQPPDQKIFVNDPVEQFSGGVHDPFGRESEASQRDGAMGVLGYLPPIHCADLWKGVLSVSGRKQVVCRGKGKQELNGLKAEENSIKDKKSCRYG